MSGDPFWQAITCDGLNVAPALAAFHNGTGRNVWEGQCDVEIRRGWLARIALGLGGFPPAGRAITLRMVTETLDGQSLWTRTFGARRMVSSQRLTRQGVEEKFGPVCLTMALSECDRGLAIRVVRMSLFGLPMPRALLPKSVSREYQDAEGRFCFDISGDLPLLGRLIRYHGWLRPASG
ncbi:DUF4166 domain-containing protein [Rhodobacteraceae bacterium LMO-12]|nr:DUF4166 domain-containing protein [Rhodobacteraceae bacterium LMO-JJ12]